MAILEEKPCGRCGGMAQWGVGQTVQFGELLWFVGIRCETCGSQTELDGEGVPHSELRNAILAEKGRWVLSIQALGPHASTALHTLRTVLGVSLTELAALRRYLPGPVAEGSRTEMRCLHALLQSQGIQASVKRAAPKS